MGDPGCTPMPQVPLVVASHLGGLATVLWLLLLERQSVGPQWSDFYCGSWKKDLLRVIGHIWSLSTGPIRPQGALGQFRYGLRSFVVCG